MAESVFYFDSGLNLRTACANDEVKNLRLVRSGFNVELQSRDNWIKFSGEEENVRRAGEFFAALSRFAHIRRMEIDQRDFEQLLRAFRDGNGSGLDALWKEKIVIGNGRKDIIPRSVNQLEYIKAMRSADVTFGIGPAGTGKTYLAMAMALAEFLAGRVSRIVLTRPARESGENLGFLPGSLEEKILPYLRPLYDALYDMLSADQVRDLVARNIIEIAPLAFMRGRTLNSAFIILDEAQNTSCEQMLMFLTRMGYGSKCIVTGDPGQSDLRPGESSGLLYAVERLDGISGISVCRFGTADVVRHALLEKIIKAFGKDLS